VRIAKGALGKGLPRRDLVVTADHGMILDGIIVTAGAMVNGGTIDFVPRNELPARYRVWHIEAEAHEVLLAEGAATESYVDYAERQAFDNHADYMARFGAARSIPEMALPRVSSARLLPPMLKARLGWGAPVTEKRAA
jgi:hypothetical protein